jgi:hypothetical protein
MAGPASSTFSPFYGEEATVMNVNRRTWTCSVKTTYSGKDFEDVQWGVPYHHFDSGEGYHFMPEPGAKCYLAQPNDSTPPFIMCFIAPPAQITATTETPVRSTTDGGSHTDVSYQSKRPDLNPGDLALTTRDGNFLILRRGGVLQLGATPLAQRVVVPVRNFLHDYCENYELATPAGDVSWLIDRPELDATGKQAASWTFHLREFAVDKNATVRVRHLPLAAAGGKKSAWEVHVAPNGIDPNTEEVTGAVYTMLLLTDGTQTEMIGSDRSIEVKGNDALKVGGDSAMTITGSHKLKAKQVTLEAINVGALVGSAVKLGDVNAMEPATKGSAMAKWLSTVVIDTPTGPGTIAPASIAAFTQQVLSKVVFLK